MPLNVLLNSTNPLENFWLCFQEGGMRAYLKVRTTDKLSGDVFVKLWEVSKWGQKLFLGRYLCFCSGGGGLICLPCHKKWHERGGDDGEQEVVNCVRRNCSCCIITRFFPLMPPSQTSFTHTDWGISLKFLGEKNWHAKLHYLENQCSNDYRNFRTDFKCGTIKQLHQI